MQDLFIDSYGEIDFTIAEDKKAVASQIGVFLSIRCTNGYIDGELEFDTYNGINFDLLLDNDVQDSIKSNYIKKQLKKYYSDLS